MDRPSTSTARVLGVLTILALLTAALLAANTTARTFLESPTALQRFPTSNAWRAAWLLRDHKPGEALGLAHDAFDPDCGWTLPAGLRNQRLAHGGVVSSNQHGARGEREYALARTPGTARIVTIGDSFTFGDDVDDDQTFSAQLARDLAPTEVLNLGVHGYGHDQMLIHLRRDGLPYAPDLVILGFFDGDGERNILTFRDYSKPRFELHDDGRLELTNVPVVAPEDYLRAHGWEPPLLLLLRLLGDRFDPQEGRDRIGPLAAALLTEIARVTRAAHAIPLFVHLPEPELAHTDPGWLRAFCGQQAIDCVFPESDFRAARARGTPLVQGTHYSPEAHGIVANALARYIGERRWLASASPSNGESHPRN